MNLVLSTVGIVALVLIFIAVAALALARRAGSPTPTLPTGGSASLDEARTRAQEIISAARTEALRIREAALDEIRERQATLDIDEGLLEERDRLLRDRNHHFNQHRHSYKERRAALDEEQAQLNEQRAGLTVRLGERAALSRDEAAALVLTRIDNELAAEHPDRVDAAVAELVDDSETAARMRIVDALQRQDQGHADGAPRTSPISLEELDEAAREELLGSLGAIAADTSMELGVDAERAQATLRGQDPLGREVARQAALEVVDRKLQVHDVPSLLVAKRTSLHRRVVEVGERALWEMSMEGRPELAELVGTLHFRFSYGQNALLHCQETGYLCGLLAVELDMDQVVAREAGMLHDIGKAVDHDVEGSHAIIGGEVLRVFGTEAGIVHAVKAHHFDEEPSTDLAMLTICADAISASRPGARRDTLASYLARLEQLQEIATRHQGVERAFPLQAGREVRIVVKARQVRDDAITALSHEIAREIESEMQYPGMIKVTVIRETMATATAPAQIGAPEESTALAASLPGTGQARRRRRGGRGRKKRNGEPDAVAGGSAPDGSAVQAD